MMKYKGFYLHMFSTLIRKHLREAYGKETTRRALKNAPGIYREMLTQVDDIGADNPMASNIYMCFVLMAIWKGAEGAITPDGFRPVIRNMVKTPLVTKILGKRDMNKPEAWRSPGKGFMKRKSERTTVLSTGIKPGITTLIKQSTGTVYTITSPTARSTITHGNTGIWKSCPSAVSWIT